MVRCAGAFSTAHHLRKRVVPEPEQVEEKQLAIFTPEGKPWSLLQGLDDRPRRIAWAKLLARLFAIDVETCPRCGGRLRMTAAVTKRAPARRRSARRAPTSAACCAPRSEASPTAACASRGILPLASRVSARPSSSWERRPTSMPAESARPTQIALNPLRARRVPSKMESSVPSARPMSKNDRETVWARRSIRTCSDAERRIAAD